MKKEQPTPQALPETFPPDAETINAIVDGMGALVMCLCKHLPPEAKAELSRDLARLSASATATGRTTVGRLMNDLSRAAAA